MSDEPRITINGCPLSTEARITHLTALAQRAWPDRSKVQVTNAASFILVTGERLVLGEWVRGTLLQIDHRGSLVPRLDALEAALLVMAGETSPVALKRAALPHHPEQSRDALRRLRGTLEKLITEWNQLAASAEQAVREPALNSTAQLIQRAIVTLGHGFEVCARELREADQDGPT